MKLKLKNKVTLVSSLKYKIKLLYLWVLLITASPALGQTSGVSNPRNNSGTVSPNFQTLGVPELVRTRCSTNGTNVYTEWTGSVYAFVPQEKQTKLFNIIGMNVARCLQNRQGQWSLTSRELTFYLNPQTNQLLDRWKNPWTGEVVPVVHIANNPVQTVVSQKQVNSKVRKPEPRRRSPMSTSSLFKWRHFLPEVILLNVRWDCRYSLSYRDLEEMMLERGVKVEHSTINRWVLKYAPELDRRIRPYLGATNDSWRVDETYIKVKEQWKYLDRAVDSDGNICPPYPLRKKGDRCCFALL